MQPTGTKTLGEGDVTYTEVEIDKEGLIRVSNASGDTGTGTRTVLAMIAAEELGVQIGDINMSTIDTDQPYDMGTFASRATTVSGQSARLACIDLKKKILKAASRITRTKQEDIKIKDGRVYIRSSKEGKKFSEIANLYRNKYGYDKNSFLGKAEYTPQSKILKIIKKDRGETLWGDWAAAHSFAAQVAEVEVDIKTGKTKLLKMTSVIDAGKILNPMNAQGHVEGAIYLGAGTALTESPIIDDEGHRLNDTFLDYKFLTSQDYPEIDTRFLESTKAYSGNLMSKGVGEIGLPGVAASIANAIFNATGARVHKIPITSEALWHTLNNASF